MSNVFNKSVQLGSASTGTFSAASSGDTKNGTSINMNDVEDGTLSAYLVATIATGSVTITPRWRVSKNNSTFYTIKDQNNVAKTAISATETVVLEAPKAVAGWPYSRLSLVVGGSTGTTGDTYDIRYSYRNRVA